MCAMLTKPAHLICNSWQTLEFATDRQSEAGPRRQLSRRLLSDWRKQSGGTTAPSGLLIGVERYVTRLRGLDQTTSQGFRYSTGQYVAKITAHDVYAMVRNGTEYK